MGWPSYLWSIVCVCASVRAAFLCFRLPKPLSDQFPVRVLVSPLYDKPSVNPLKLLRVKYTEQIAKKKDSTPSASQGASDFDPASHADFGAAIHPGVGGGTHRRRATFDRCKVRGVVLRVVVCGAVLVVCLCVCDRFAFLQTVYIYIYIYTYIHTYSNTNIYTNTHTCVYTHTHLSMSVSHIYTHMHAYIYIHMYVYLYIQTYVHMYIYKYEYMYKHTHMCVRTHTYLWMGVCARACARTQSLIIYIYGYI